MHYRVSNEKIDAEICERVYENIMQAIEDKKPDIEIRECIHANIMQVIAGKKPDTELYERVYEKSCEAQEKSDYEWFLKMQNC